MSVFLNYHLLSRQDCDISNIQSIENAIAHYKPWAIINAAGFVRVDDAEQEVTACHNDNTVGPLNLAMACNKAGIQLMTYSSDLVFDGTKENPYVESDQVNPLNIYGHSKAKAEEFVSNAFPSSLIIRTSAFFSPWDEYNFVHYVRKQLSQYEGITVANDLIISPTYVPHLVNASLDILIDEEKGIWHLANKGAITWADLAYEIADRFELDKAMIHSVSANEINYPAQRPVNSALGTEKGHLLPSLENAIEEYFRKEKTEKRRVA